MKVKIFPANLILFFICFSAPNWAIAQEKEDKSEKIAVITSTEWNSIESISLADLKGIFFKNTISFKGKEVIPVQRAGNSEIRMAFDKLVLNMDENQLKNFWIQEKLAGRENPPKSFNSLNSLLFFLKKKVGAIGYVEATALSEEMLSEVKIIPIQIGNQVFLPDANNYPLSF